jgi:hypothetical protein
VGFFEEPEEIFLGLLGDKYGTRKPLKMGE